MESYNYVMKRGFADTKKGQIHYALAGEGEPILFLHQTPRSWDEYRDVLPIVGKHYKAIAMDTIGFGDSYRLEKDSTIEDYTAGVIDFLDAMGIDRTNIVGHHTGGVIAVELAASYPERIKALILSSTPFVDAEDRKKRKNRPPIDEVKFKNDGSHLTELWQKRMPFYPKDNPGLLTRFVLDALKVWDGLEEGHKAVDQYEMEKRITLVKAPTLIMTGSEDPFSFSQMKLLANAIRGSETRIVEGGMVPMADQLPQKFAAVVLGFLDDQSLRGKRVFIVDDEPDILEILEDLLEPCIIDKADNFLSAKKLIETKVYDAVILDIMGVKGYDLLMLTTKKDIPTLMLTSHVLSPEDFVRSIKEGAQAYVPKDKMANIKIFLRDIFDETVGESTRKKSWFSRLEPFFKAKFGPYWKESNTEFWKYWNV